MATLFFRTLWKFIGTFQSFYHTKINVLEASLELI